MRDQQNSRFFHYRLFTLTDKRKITTFQSYCDQPAGCGQISIRYPERLSFRCAAIMNYPNTRLGFPVLPPTRPERIIVGVAL